MFKPETGRRLLAPWLVRQLYHRAELHGVENIPATGPVLLVSNHGRLDFDSFILMRMLLRDTGRFPRSMADRMWFNSKLTACVAEAAGAVEGNRANAKQLLQEDQMVLTYPGGVREIFVQDFGAEKIAWCGHYGFARLAVETGTPVIPIAGKGVNNGFVFLTSGRWLGKLMFKYILRVGDDWANYRDPLVLGLLPLPVPFSMAVHFPWPCKLSYRVLDPIQPPTLQPGQNLEDAATAFAAEVGSALQDALNL